MMLRARRLLLGLTAMILVGLAALVLRLAYLQAGQGRVPDTVLADRTRGHVALPSRRGDVLDRHGRPLARSVRELRVQLWPPKVLTSAGQPRDRADVEQSIAAILGGLEGRVGWSAERLEATVRAALAASAAGAHRNTQLGEVVTDPFRIEELLARADGELRRLDLVSSSSRVHPWGATAGNLVGFVGHTGEGAAGLELGLQSLLAGADGRRRVRLDGGRHPILSPDDAIVAPRDGCDVQLTIDATLQQLVEEDLVQLVAEQEAEGAAAVVLDATSGDVLCLASAPLLDAADTAARVPDAMRMRAVQDQYAPGSSLKPLMMAVALELGLVTPSSRIDCRTGAGRFGRRRVTDTKPQERELSPAEILVYSSNIGMAGIFTRLVPEDDTRNTALMAPVREMLVDLGLGRATGLPLPGELAGQVSPLEDWTRNYTLVSVSFGYELGVTPLQMAAAVAALADGHYRPPRLLSAWREPGGRWQAARPAAPRRVFSARVATQVREWMVDVVEEGSSAPARIEGVPIAGKTGTAYDETDHGRETHSFVALVPADAPRLALLVFLDHPRHGRFASRTTVPTAGRVLRRALAYLGQLPPDS